jgi:hypothetical protein
MNFNLTVVTKSGTIITRFKSVRMAHVELGRVAERENLDVHVHPKRFSSSALSVAYTKGGDMLLDVKAFVAAGR